tara:strand:+ start:127385 stop:128173 length:789 start_codon:yes stop_codon:yes gene_type:complete
MPSNTFEKEVEANSVSVGLDQPQRFSDASAHVTTGHSRSTNGLRLAREIQIEHESTLTIPIRVYEMLKRAFDIVAATMLLLILSVPLLVIGLIIRLSDGGSMFFVQTRIGRFGRPFKCYKLRTMVSDAERIKDELSEINDHGQSITFKIRRDPRITPIGRLLRKTSIDELPQLLNVLRGEMSLVGPRPAVPREVRQYTYRDHQRLSVQPGLTCVWQVSGRGDVSFDGQVEMDLDYINRRSFSLDLKLLVLTIPAVLSTRGAY